MWNEAERGVKANKMTGAWETRGICRMLRNARVIVGDVTTRFTSMGVDFFNWWRRVATQSCAYFLSRLG